MKLRIPIMLILAVTFTGASSLFAQKPKVDVLKGPATAKLGDVAQINVPAGFVFLDGKTTRALLKASGETPSGNELGFIRPTNADWSVIFEFDASGYVKDDDKDKLDAPKLLQSYKDGTKAQNKEREAAGRPLMQIVGWEQEPRYDPDTHNLTWAIRATSGGQPF